MVDLSEVAGMPLKFDERTCHVSFGKGMRRPSYDTRELDALRPVLMDPDAVGPEVVYWMYRNCGRLVDAALLEAYDLRYDVSAFVSARFGPEYMKTSGHYHPDIPGQRIAYPEVYEIIYGEALYVLQKVADYGAPPARVQVEDIIIARVRAGQKAIMPPGYGHVTVNTLDRPLVMSNWVSDRFSSFYGSVEECQGFAQYVVERDGEPAYVKNERYKRDLPEIRFAQVQEVPELGVTWDTPLYQACAEAPERFEFLNDPGKYEQEIWSGLKML
jgi:glucose-6-phosphate isomerase